MLVLLSIPEFFLRSIYSSVFNYSELLKGIGIGKLQQKDDDYYRKCIMNRSVSEIYTDIFNAISIDNYPDYIGFCEDVDFSDGDLIKIVQTYRILFNKLKHSSYIQIIKSRDDETIKKNNLKNIEREIEELQAMQYTDEQNVQSKLRN